MLRADIVPVYHLGSSQMLRCTGSSDWSRRMRMSMCVFWGRWGLPLPYKHDIVSLVGTPVTGESPPFSCDFFSYSLFQPFVALVGTPVTGQSPYRLQNACAGIADARRCRSCQHACDRLVVPLFRGHPCVFPLSEICV